MVSESRTVGDATRGSVFHFALITERLRVQQNARFVVTQGEVLITRESGARSTRYSRRTIIVFTDVFLTRDAFLVGR